MFFDFLIAESSAIIQVVVVDLVLAGDNAIIIGMVAATVAEVDRRKVIIFGIIAATVLRIVFALITVQLLQIIGIVLLGGLLLLWVCWKLWSDIHNNTNSDSDTVKPVTAPSESLRNAIFRIVVADASMSLDNVLAVAGIARHNATVLVFGLVLSIILMAVAATAIAKMLEKYPWIVYIGLLTILYVALKMIYDGGLQLIQYF